MEQTSERAISGPGDVTPELVTRCLREAGFASADVRSLRGTRIGTGQIGQCVRYELELAGDSGDTPRSLVGKFPSDDPTSRQTGVLLGNFWKEVSFYQELQPRLGIRTPRCYYARIEGRGPEHALLLEDLAPAAQGDQLRGCTPAVARAAVLELVGLHAPTWCDRSLRALEWLGAPDESTVQIGRTLYQAQLPAFLARFRERLAADEVAILSRVAMSAGPPFEPLGDVFAALHVDYRLDNLLIDESQTPPASPSSTGRASPSATRSPTSPTSWAPASCRTTAAPSSASSSMPTIKASSPRASPDTTGSAAGTTTAAASSPASRSRSSPRRSCSRPSAATRCSRRWRGATRAMRSIWAARSSSAESTMR